MPAESWEWVTPAQAAAWLRLNVGNRPLDQSRVDQYRRSMSANEWRSHLADPIRLATCADGSEMLIDGQHRLTAIVDLERKIFFKVIRGLSVDDREFIDQGKPRTGADVAGFAGIKQAALMIAVARRVMAMERGDTDLTPADISRPSNNAVVAFILQNELKLRASMLAGRRVGSGCRPLRGAALGLAHYLLSKDHPAEMVTEFFDRAADGQDLPAGSPILILRSRAIADSGKRIRVTDAKLLEMVLHSFGLWRSGRTLARYVGPRRQVRK